MLAKVALFLVVTTFFTLTGWYFTWLQVHSPDWRGKAAVVLILPYLLVNRAMRWLFTAGAMPAPVYWLAFILGSFGQLLYYFAIFSLIKRLASGVRAMGRGNS